MLSKGRYKINKTDTMSNKTNKKSEQEVPELLTLQEACDLLKVHPNTLRQWDKNGILPAIRIGTKRVRRYRKENIVELLNQKL
jgi:excisionase family DNA binding protein